MPPPCFQVTFHGLNLWDLHPPQSGMQIHTPELTWILAAVWANETLASFRALPEDDQALIIAAYVTDRQMQAVLADAAQQQRRAQWRRGAHIHRET